MSQFLIKQRVFSWMDNFDINDTAGNPIYVVRADIFNIGHKVRLFKVIDGRKDKLLQKGIIDEKRFRLFREYEIIINAQPQGKIKKQFSVFHPKYEIDYKGWRLEGDFLQWNYSIYENSRCVVRISKQPFHMEDTYLIDIENDEDEIPALLIAVAMDAARSAEGNTYFNR